MNDPLKKILNQHKEKLFSEELSSNHLSKFEEKLNTEFGTHATSSKNWIYYSGIAASLAFLITLGIVFFNSNQTEENTIVQSEVQESENFFALAVEHKIKQLKTYETPQTKPYIDQCLKALNQLDQDYTDLKKDFNDTGNDQLINLMLDNLKKRVDILEELIQQLEHYKNQGYEL